MLDKTSVSFREYFLLQFTRQLIKNAGADEFLKQGDVMKKEQNVKEKVHKKIKEQEKAIKLLKEESAKKNLVEEIKREKRDIFPKKNPVLRIPEPKLPQTFQYLKPTPTKTEIYLDKLEPLIKDPLVKIIECNGPNSHILVSGSMGTKPTGIILTKEEIEEIIQKFSSASKIPAHEGVFKAVFGRLIFSAIVSKIVGSKFIIKKMMYYPGFGAV